MKSRRILSIRLPFDINNYSEDECQTYFRFKKYDLDRLQQALQIPEHVKLDNRVKFTGKLYRILSQFLGIVRY